MASHLLYVKVMCICHIIFCCYVIHVDSKYDVSLVMSLTLLYVTVSVLLLTIIVIIIIIITIVVVVVVYIS